MSRQPFSPDCGWPAARDIHLRADLSDPAAVEALVAAVRERLPDGRQDALVRNAGISPKGLDRGPPGRAGHRARRLARRVQCEPALRRTLSAGTADIVERRLPMRRLGEAHEVTETILFLCSGASSYVDGAEIHINGGQHV